MKRLTIGGTTLAVVASLAIGGSALAVNGFTDGSFEGGAAGTTTVAAGSTIGSWTVTGTDVDWVSVTDLWQAKSGTKSVDLNGFGTGGVEQSFATTLNSTYVVQFWMSGNPGTCLQYPNGACSPVVKTMTVHATGGTTDQFTFDASANTFADMGWQVQGYSFRAAGGTSVLSFASTTVGSFGPALDFVTVTEVAATGANCKDDGWQTMRDGAGVVFKNQGACVSFYAKSGQTPIGN